MINPDHGLSLTRQAEILRLSRASLYYERVGVSQADLKLMRRIDELQLEWPFLGSRILRNMLRLEGIAVGRKHVATLMRKMGIEAIYRRANTSRRHPRHAIYPYLLRNLTIDRPNQVRATDVTYIPMARGFVYLVAVLDWFSRRVLSWRVSNSMTADFCVEALEEAISRYGAPEIFNTDQGSQFTAASFIDVLQRNQIRISMDGRGAWRDNVFVERLWRLCAQGHYVAGSARRSRFTVDARRMRAHNRHFVPRHKMEVGQVRRGLSACVRLRGGSQGWDPTLFFLLQQPASAHVT